ncbi:MAG TPA: hypothetical protein VFD33_04880, partial [Bacillota bacterium]|nr:hypothetical protein [Bacillota bacterium]
MKKFYCILLMVGLLLALSHAALADVCNNAWDGVVKDIPALFNKLDGELIGIEISGRAKVNDQDMTFDQLDQLFNEVANQFGHLAGPIERVGQGLSASVRQIKGQAIRGQNLYTVALNNGYNLAEGGGYETYIVVNIASKPMPDTGVKSLRQTLFDFLASYSNDPCMGTLYKARTQKKLDKKSMINT